VEVVVDFLPLLTTRDTEPTVQELRANVALAREGPDVRAVGLQVCKSLHADSVGLETISTDSAATFVSYNHHIYRFSRPFFALTINPVFDLVPRPSKVTLVTRPLC
jgi:hypothetical protein